MKPKTQAVALKDSSKSSTGEAMLQNSFEFDRGANKEDLQVSFLFKARIRRIQVSDTMRTERQGKRYAGKWEARYEKQNSSLTFLHSSRPATPESVIL